MLEPAFRRLPVALVACLAPICLLVSICSPASRAHADTSGPSFSCAGATDIPAVICKDPGLSAADRRMTLLYGTVHQDVVRYAPSQQQTRQRAWLKDLNTACASGAWAKRAKTQAACITERYNDRLAELAISALLSQHDLAMAEIKRATPDDDATYEAIYQYATIDAAQPRATKVAQTLTPVFAAFTADVKERITGLDGAGTPAQAVASDKAFATFVALANTEGGHTVTWPCAVLLKRPGLLAGMGAMYGSSMDNQLPDSDCAIMAPKLDGAEALVHAAVVAAPECDGTIRFAGYRELYRLDIAMLLHRPDQWGTNEASQPDSNEAAFRRKNATAIVANRKALSAYYAKAFHIDAATALRDATRILDLQINQAYSVC